MNATSRILVLAAAMLTFAATASAQTASQPTSEKAGAYKIEYTRLGPTDAKAQNIAQSPDGRHLAHITFRDQKACVVVDGQAGAEYDGIVKGTPLFSPDSKRVAYVAIKGEKSFVVVDHQACAEYYEILEGTLIFSPHGTLEYLAIRDNSLYRVKHISAKLSAPIQTKP